MEFGVLGTHINGANAEKKQHKKHDHQILTLIFDQKKTMQVWTAYWIKLCVKVYKLQWLPNKSRFLRVWKSHHQIRNSRPFICVPLRSLTETSTDSLVAGLCCLRVKKHNMAVWILSKNSNKEFRMCSERLVRTIINYWYILITKI